MYLFAGLVCGFYVPEFLPVHILFWLSGYLFRVRLKSPKSRWIFFGVLAVLILIGELACRYWFTLHSKLFPIAFLTLILDLLIGYFAKDFFKIIRRGIHTLIDWIKKDET